MLVASLVTLGPPEQLTGGYLYHRRLAELAPAHGARLDLVPLPALPFPLPAGFGGRGAGEPGLGGGARRGAGWPWTAPPRPPGRRGARPRRWWRCSTSPRAA